MCGIAGYVGRGTKDNLEKMIEVIKYRGPDTQNFLVRDIVGLGHARLSIIDTSSLGVQPMETSDKSVVIVFNGEIYNFQELRSVLQKKYQFANKTDTEVILYAYKEYGDSCFEKLDGMFALALYDFEKKKLILARDRMGKKPLYWFYDGKTMAFASELTSLLQHPSIKKELNLEALGEFFSYDYVPTPLSMIKNVHKLEPASLLILEKGQIKKIKYWNPKFDELDISLTEAIEKFNELFSNAVQKRLISDVPLGIFLSGGLDSSAVASYAQKHSLLNTKTFSIGFEEKSFDESEHALRVSKALGTDHHIKYFKMSEAGDRIPEILQTIDEPLGDASFIPTFLLSEFARTKLTVALGGDGGDELFAGYPTFQAEKMMGLTKVLPTPVKRVFRKIVDLIKPSHKNFSFDFVLKKLMDGWEEKSIVSRHMKWLGGFTRDQKSQLLSQEILNSIDLNKEFSIAHDYFNEHKDMSEKNRLLHTYQRTYMMDGVLAKVDRASMRTSLEVRTPFLDYKIVEFVNSLPYSYKLRGFTTKYLLKKAMAKKIPQEIIQRKKKGFGMPVGEWLRGDLKNYCDSVLSTESIVRGGIFNPDYIEQIKKEHFEGRQDHRKKLWDLLVFEVWRQKNIA